MADNFLNKTIAEKYRIDAILHGGETESLYAGIHLPTNRPVSVKLLSEALASDPTIAERFIDEAKAASQISHPNILNITDFGIDKNGFAYIVYESFVGEPLTELLAKESKLDQARAVNIANEIALALTAIHSTEKAAGSLNPNEVIVLDEPQLSGQVKLVNIGNDHYESDNLPLFKVYYLSPEQCADLSDADARSDIYSLGVMLYQMLAGEPPFLADNTTDLMMKHVEEMPPPMSSYRSDLSPEIEPIILKALSKDPEMRQQTADEFIAELAALNISPTKAAAAASGSSKKWLTAFLVLIGVGALAAFMIYATSSKQTLPTTVLQHDANGMPVQPLNPATGVEEMRMLASMPAGSVGFDNPGEAAVIPPDTIPGGDGYNPWAAGGAPPVGAPPQGYVAPGGQVYTIDPNGSQFMPPGDGVILVPIPATPRPSPSAKGTPKPADIGEPAQPTPKPAETKPTPAPKPPAQKQPADDKVKPAGAESESADM